MNITCIDRPREFSCIIRNSNLHATGGSSRKSLLDIPEGYVDCLFILSSMTCEDLMTVVIRIMPRIFFCVSVTIILVCRFEYVFIHPHLPTCGSHRFVPWGFLSRFNLRFDDHSEFIFICSPFERNVFHFKQEPLNRLGIKQSLCFSEKDLKAEFQDREKFICCMTSSRIGESPSISELVGIGRGRKKLDNMRWKSFKCRIIW